MTEVSPLLTALFGGLEGEPYRIAYVSMAPAHTGERDLDVTNYTVKQALGRGKPLETLAKKRDVYFALGVQPGTQPKGTRAKAQDVAGIGGVWADLDVATLLESKKRFPSVEAAEFMLDNLPLRPSAIVHSGGGVHAYWIFDEPWIFEDEAERDLAKRCLQGWNGFVARSAKGVDIDSTHDLARIFRVPGTLNHKEKTPRAVELARLTSLRYNPSDFEMYAPKNSATFREPVGDIHPSRKLDEKTELFLEAWLERPTNVATWYRKRVTMGRKDDHTRSGYLLAIATSIEKMQIRMDEDRKLNEQQLADLLTEHCRLHNDLDGLHVVKLKKTISKARTIAKEEAHEEETRDARKAARKEGLEPPAKEPIELAEAREAREVIDDLREDGGAEPEEINELEEKERNAYMKLLRKKTASTISRVIREDAAGATETVDKYSIQLDDGRFVFLGSRSRVLSTSENFEAAMLRGGASCQVDPSYRAKARWSLIVSAMLRNAEALTSEHMLSPAERVLVTLLQRSKSVRWESGIGHAAVLTPLLGQLPLVHVEDTGELWFTMRAAFEEMRKYWGPADVVSESELRRLIEPHLSRRRWRRYVVSDDGTKLPDSQQPELPKKNFYVLNGSALETIKGDGAHEATQEDRHA